MGLFSSGFTMQTAGSQGAKLSTCTSTAQPARIAARGSGSAATTESAILVDYALNLKNNNAEGAAERVNTMLEFLGLDSALM